MNPTQLDSQQSGRRIFPPSPANEGFAGVERTFYWFPPIRSASSELGPLVGSSPKSCVKSLCSSFFLLGVLLCQARLAGPSISVGIKNRFLPKPSVQLLGSSYDRISCLHQECPTILFPFFIQVHQNRANQAFC